MNLRPFALFLTLAGICPAAESASNASPMKPSYGLVIHGGAGVITREKLSPELETRYRADLARALDAGHAVLSGGGVALDAVVAAIRVLEDSPL